MMGFLTELMRRVWSPEP
ncbi:MAG: hypothetical protein CISAcid_05230 [uncultured Acidilobus sp. CIS]|jgi:hypothetical protein|nr:MAG: hypothetical protein CISAcid_05230 [uncultured Acidilobus sp. CIS]